ncbi:prepilin-type N-terminal cleavage/methylation domain-containing protein [Halolactibacillus halophilus]|uniref:Prepilin-type N-terminal cleavage/methylation domain-containing protein n=2 Tax=Halolactibacillus halophilus TaxID=306540 RepID=A0A1I5L147_9BACI|nr:prepilin-type N-terminal cleavage/methylation domain-containing protein [Halolactibacillus halophilus]
MSVMKKYCNEKGLTLVEVLASIVILSLIVVTFLAFFINSARTTEISEENLNASFIAQEYMEEVYNIVTDNPTLESIRSNIKALDPVSAISLTTYKITDLRGTGTITIEQAKDESNQEIDRLLKVVVTFRVPDGKDAKLETRMIYGEVDTGV